MSDVAAVPEEPIRAAFLELRYKAIRAHIAKGDKAKDKAEQHYITAGQHLRALKAEHAGTWDEWEALLKDKIGIGKSRASELMQIADGRKTVEGIRADTAERTAKTRALQSSPLRSGEKGGEAVIPALNGDDMPSEAEAEESFQETLYDHACHLVDRMDDETRQFFFAWLGKKYHAEFEAASCGSAAHVTENVDDGLDIPDYLRREPKAPAA
jgi:hypothetical protein